MRAGVPVIPIAVVGAEESMPTLANIAPLAKALGVPYAPLTANMLAFGPLLGPLGSLLYFPAKFKLQGARPGHFDVPPDQPRYSRSRRSWTSPRPSASRSRRRSTTCSATAARSGPADGAT